ncbi:MAG: hypothetical protein EBQ82_00490 [Betaproteobacteria bacterium]|nr:hypothetical protein [Betaproteobacteria bacterium]NBY03890.1 hypothetical protein [Betaproteobacteria bacterium]
MAAPGQEHAVEIKNSWYLIEQDRLHRVVTVEEFSKLAPDSFVLHQVFATHREALHEMSRLIKLEIQDVKEEVDKMIPPDSI